MTIATLRGADLHFLLVEILGVDVEACAHCSGRMHTLRVAIYDGVKVKINERTWSPPLGEAEEVR